MNQLKIYRSKKLKEFIEIQKNQSAIYTFYKKSTFYYTFIN